MIERRDRARLALKPGVETLLHDLDGHRTPESRIDAPKDFAHAALAQLALHLVGSQAGSGVQNGHCRIAGELRAAVEKQAIVFARQQRFHFAAQFGIGPCEQSLTLVWGRVASRVIQLFDLPQTIRRHIRDALS